MPHIKHTLYMGVFHQSLANDLSQFERRFLDNEFPGLSPLPLSLDEIDSTVYSYVFIDLDVESLGDDVMNAHGLTLFQFVGNVSYDVQLSLHGAKLLGYRWRHVSL